MQVEGKRKGRKEKSDRKKTSARGWTHARTYGEEKKRRKKKEEGKKKLSMDTTTGHVLIWADKSAYCMEFDRDRLLSYALDA